MIDMTMRRSLGDEHGVAQLSASSCRSWIEHRPHFLQSRPNSSNGAGHLSSTRRHLGISSSRRSNGMVASCSRQASLLIRTAMKSR